MRKLNSACNFGRIKRFERRAKLQQDDFTTIQYRTKATRTINEIFSEMCKSINHTLTIIEYD